MSRFSINADMLGIVCYLCRVAGPQFGQSGSVFFLREIHDQIQADEIEDHIADLAMDTIPSKVRETLIRFILSHVSLSEKDERFLRDRGFLYGGEAQAPQAIITWCEHRRNFYQEAGFLD